MCEAAFAPPLGLLRPLPLQTSIQTLQAVLRPLGAAGGHGPVPDARGPHRHQHDHPQRYAGASASLRVLLTWRSCPFFLLLYSPVCPFGSCRMEIRLVYLRVFLDTCPRSGSNACGCTFIQRKKRKNILEYLCYHLLLSSLVSLIRSLLLAFPRWLSVWHDFYLIRRVIMNIVMEQWRWSVAVHSRLNGAETKKRNRLWLDARQIKRTWNCLKIKKQPRFKGVFLKEGGCQSNNDSHSFRQSVSPKIHINIWIYV